MNIVINFVHTDKKSVLEDQVKTKLERLSKKYDWITSAQVFLKEEKHPNQMNFECEIKLSIPGPQLFAKDANENFHKAINETVQDLGVQLEKRKDLMQEKR